MDFSTIKDGWLPTPDNINALPGPLRKYVCRIETLCDPAGMVAENMLLKDQTRQLDAMIKRLKNDLAVARLGEHHGL